jgi:hypothetical protein
MKQFELVSKKFLVENGWMQSWFWQLRRMDGWMDEWIGVKAVLRDCLGQSKIFNIQKFKNLEGHENKEMYLDISQIS